jgi:hypothetical protein
VQPTDVSGQFWVQQGAGPVAVLNVEDDKIAFAIFGIWGAGQGVSPLMGTLQDVAEVWFSKV